MNDIEKLIERADAYLTWWDSGSSSADPIGHDQLIRDLRAALQNQGWQDISSAPKDGTEVIGYDADDKIRCIIRWGKHNHVPLYGWIYQVELYGEEVDGFDPTHWQPLLAPPASSEGI